MHCTPCERTFAQVATLLETLKKETLSLEAQMQAKVLAVSLAHTGYRLIEMKLREVGNGRDHYKAE